MRTHSKWLFYLTALLILTSACNNGLAVKITGSWRGVEGESALVMEFFRDGRVVNTYAPGATLEGTWQRQSGSTVSVSIDPWELTAGLIGDTLVLYDGGNKKKYIKTVTPGVAYDNK